MKAKALSRVLLVFCVVTTMLSFSSQFTLGQEVTLNTPSLAPVASQDSKAEGKVFVEPMVARVELRLTIGEKEVDDIEKGDLLTVLEERPNSFLIRTFRDVQGGIEKSNLVSLAESVETYDEIVRDNPKTGRYYSLRAGAHWARGNAEKALADFDQAIKLGYDSANAYASRALFLTSSHEYEKAITDFSKAIEKGDKSESIYINRAAAYLQMNKADEAIADYTTAIQLNNKNAGVLQQRAAVAFNNRGYNYSIIGKYTEALLDYKKAIELTPEYALAHQNLGWLLSTCKDVSLRDPVGAVEAAEPETQQSEK